MHYHIYEFKFSTGVHFGISSLEDTGATFGSDTLFSALCIEALKMGGEKLNLLIQYVKNGRLLFSDAFPLIDGEYYLPKPIRKIEYNDIGDSDSKKVFKNMKYIPFSSLDKYLQGKFTVSEAEKVKIPGYKLVKVSAAIKENEDAEPFRVGTYYFADNESLYIIIKTENDEIKDFIEELIDGLSLTGIGGKRNTGLGKFEFHNRKISDFMLTKLENDAEVYMSLSGALPRENELEEAMENAEYMLLKRSGFVSSSSYCDSFMRKKDLYIFASGSCFRRKFEGDVYDVSSNGTHPVYRYAKPIFIGV